MNVNLISKGKDIDFLCSMTAQTVVRPTFSRTIRNTLLRPTVAPEGNNVRIDDCIKARAITYCRYQL